jgi:hypothetical protein
LLDELEIRQHYFLPSLPKTADAKESRRVITGYPRDLGCTSLQVSRPPIFQPPSRRPAIPPRYRHPTSTFLDQFTLLASSTYNKVSCDTSRFWTSAFVGEVEEVLYSTNPITRPNFGQFYKRHIGPQARCANRKNQFFKYYENSSPSDDEFTTLSN